jgi:hypothetical protein
MQKVASGQTRMAMRACCVPVVLITVITVYAQKIELDCTVHVYMQYIQSVHAASAVQKL